MLARRSALTLFPLLAGLGWATHVVAQSTVTTYQGQLVSAGAPANGNHGFVFQLCSTAAGPGGVLQAFPPAGTVSVNVIDGLFTQELPFDAAHFTGAERWLEVEVNGNTLSPRQHLTSAPYATNSTRLNGQVAAFYQNAGNLSAGTLADARLSANVGLLSGTQTFTGAKTLSNAGNAFTGSGAGLTSLNASNLSAGTVPGGRLSGTYANALSLSNAGNSFTGNGAGLTTLNASNVNAGTLSLNGSVESEIIEGRNSNTTNFSVGLRGHSSAASGLTIGVVGQSASTAGVGVQGRVTATSGLNWGGFFECSSTGGRAVVGEAEATSGSTYGVHGLNFSTAGRGVFGHATANSGNTVGVYGEADSLTGYGVYSNGDLRANGDITATGSKSGYVSDIVLNGGTEPLLPGELVEIVGQADPIVGDIPVIVVRKTQTANARGVLGPIDCALQTSPIEPDENEELKPARLRYAHPQYDVHKIEGAIAPGAYGRAVTLGSFNRINVDATFGAIRPGDLLVSSQNTGLAMRSDEPKVGTVVGKALGSLSSGTGAIGVLVQGR